VELLICFLVSIFSFFVLIKMLRSSVDRMNNKSLSWLPVALSIIWFSPVQIENWLWGWQLEWFLNVLGVILVAFGVSKLKDRNNSNASIALILSGGILAQYSLGNGTLVWPIVIAILLYYRAQIKKITLVTFTAILTTTLYYVHYINPSEPSKTLAIRRPIQAIEYVLGYLGRPLSFYHKPAMAIGFILLLLFTWMSIHLFRFHKVLFKKSLPWIMLGLYAIGSSLITCIARLGFGTAEAYSSRYTTISSLLLVSVIVLGWNARKIIHQHLGDNFRIMTLLAAIGIFCLVAIEWGWGIHSAINEHTKLETIKQCTAVQQPSPDCLILTYPNPAIVSPRLQYIKSIGWGGYTSTLAQHN
jgi:hypothetical protein